MKLNLIFIAMDILTLLAYPIVFVHDKIQRFLKPQRIIISTEELTKASVMQMFDPL